MASILIPLPFAAHGLESRSHSSVTELGGIGKRLPLFIVGQGASGGLFGGQALSVCPLNVQLRSYATKRHAQVSFFISVSSFLRLAPATILLVSTKWFRPAPPGHHQAGYFLSCSATEA